MADEPVLLTETTGWGVRLTLNRPSKLNALSAELIDALTAAIAAAADDDRVRVIAIAGTGRWLRPGHQQRHRRRHWPGATSSHGTLPPPWRSGHARNP